MNLSEQFADMWHYIEVQAPSGPFRDDLLSCKVEIAKLEAKADRYDWIMKYAPDKLVGWIHDNLDYDDISVVANEGTEESETQE